MGYGSGKEYTRNPVRNKDGLMPQEAKFAELVPKVGPAEAAKQAYPEATPKSQTVIASQNMAKDDIVLSISKTADRLGLNRESCVETIKEGLKATRLNGKDAVEHADHSSRLKAAELGLKLHGHLKDNAVIVPVPVSKEKFLDLCEQFWASKPK